EFRRWRHEVVVRWLRVLNDSLAALGGLLIALDVLLSGWGGYVPPIPVEFRRWRHEVVVRWLRVLNDSLAALGGLLIALD
ncbi:hypothetical protein ACNQT2_11665, partial [Corynebacterium diphtheriae]